MIAINPPRFEAMEAQREDGKLVRLSEFVNLLKLAGLVVLYDYFQSSPLNLDTISEKQIAERIYIQCEVTK